MTDEAARWRRVEALFNDVVDLGDAERDARLADEDDEEIVEDVRDLLASERGAGTALHNVVGAEVVRLADERARPEERSIPAPVASEGRARRARRWPRGRIIVATLVAAALVIALVVSLVAARHAERRAGHAEQRFDDVRGLASAMVFEVDQKIRELPGATAARELLVSRALAYLDRLASDDDDDLAREVALGYMRVGDIQGGSDEPSLGRSRDGLASYDKAKALLVRLRERTADSAPEARVIATAEVAWLFGSSALSRAAGDAERARRDVARGLAAAAALPAADIDRPLLMRGCRTAVDIEVGAGDLIAARAAVARFVAQAEAWRDASGGDEARYWVAIAHAMRARIAGHGGDPDAAVVDVSAARDEVRRLARAHPDDARFAREEARDDARLAGYLGGVGEGGLWIASIGDAAAAEREAEAAVAASERVIERDPFDARAIEDRAGLLVNLAMSVARHDAERALTLFEEARAAWERLGAVADEAHRAASGEWLLHCALAEQRALRGDRSAAAEEETRGLEMVGGRVDEGLQCHYLIARARVAAGDPDVATAIADDVIAALEGRVAARSSAIGDYVGLVEALTLRAVTTPDDACRSRLRALSAWDTWTGPTSAFVRRRHDELLAAARGCGAR